MQLNHQLFFRFHDLAHHDVFFDKLVIFVGERLDILVLSILLITLFIVGFRRQIRSYRLVCVSCYELLINIVGVGLVARGIAEIIKIAAHASRPFAEFPDVVKPLFQHGSGFDSFPSGHATLFFALAVMIFKHHKGWGFVMLIVAILISLSRVIAGVHYPIDIAVGAVLGIMVAITALHFDMQLFHNKDNV